MAKHSDYVAGAFIVTEIVVADADLVQSSSIEGANFGQGTPTAPVARAMSLGSSFKRKQGNTSVMVPIAAFPQSAQGMLSKYDTDGDATLNVEEILQGFKALEREQNKVQWLLRSLSAFTVLCILLLGAMGGLIYGVIDASKDTSVQASVLTIKGQPDVPVQTASTEFTVVDNTLMTRVKETCDGSLCERNTLAMATSAKKARLSSALPDDDLQELKSMTLRQGSSFLHFSVRAIARYEETFSRWGSVVVIYTHAGELTLDDTAVSFHESLQGTFSRAGFSVDGSRRRLLGLVEILGVFNRLNYASAGAPQGPQPLPPHFNAEVTTYIECWPAVNCHNDATGELVDWADSPSKSADYPTVSWQGQLASRNFDGQRAGAEVHIAPAFEAQQLVRVYNMTHRFTAQRYGGKDYHCAVEESNWMTQTQSTTNLGAGASLFFVANVERSGRACRHWRVQQEGQADIDAFEDATTGQIFQLQFLFFVWQFDALTALPAVEHVPVPADLDIRALAQACPADLVAPTPRFDLENWEDRVVADPAWGTPTGGRRAAPHAHPLRGVERSKTVLGVLDRVYAAGFRR